MSDSVIQMDKAKFLSVVYLTLSFPILNVAGKWDAFECEEH